ncbi:MAG: hypothetical protein AAGB93_13215 [Planctomycetota bacterium]
MTIERGPFEWDGSSWAADVILLDWRGFPSRRGAYGTRDTEAPSDGSTTLIFAPEGRDDTPLTDEEIRLVHWFLDHQGDVAQAAIRGIAAHCLQMREQYGFEDDGQAESMPDLDGTESLEARIGLMGVTVHRVAKHGVPYVGFELGCD